MIEGLRQFGTALLQLFVESAPFLLLGFGIAGLLHTFLSNARIAAWLGPGRAFAVLRAALVGVPLPLCSCSVVPVAAQLRRSGASRGATTAFLISTPETGVDSIAITYALTDPILTIARPLAAFFSAAVGGYLQNWFNPDPPPATAHPVSASAASSCCCGGASKPETQSVESMPSALPQLSLPARFATAARHGFGTLLGTLALYLVIGFVLAAALSVLLTRFEPLRLALTSPWAPLWMLIAGVPMYVCASSATPLVAVLIAQGLSPGAGLVFLMSGPATNAATIVVLRQILGGRGVMIYLAAIAGTALLCGFALDAVYAALGGPRFAGHAHLGHEHAAQVSAFGVLCAIVFALLLVAALYRRYLAPRLGRSAAGAGPVFASQVPIQITLATARNGISGTR